jgi:hypothetical protein
MGRKRGHPASARPSENLARANLRPRVGIAAGRRLKNDSDAFGGALEPSGSFAAFVPYLAEAIPAVRLVLRARRAFGVHVGEEVTCGNQDESYTKKMEAPLPWMRFACPASMPSRIEAMAEKIDPTPSGGRSVPVEAVDHVAREEVACQNGRLGGVQPPGRCGGGQDPGRLWKFATRARLFLRMKL